MRFIWYWRIAWGIITFDILKQAVVLVPCMLIGLALGMLSSKVLSDYMTLINKIRIYKKEMANIKEAVDRAVNECIEEEILVEFLRKHRGDIMANVLTEFNEEVFVRGIREEGREEGREEARVEYIHVMIETLREVGQSEEVIAQKLMEKYGLTKAETENYMN